jgi:hypothetical protein
MFIELKNEHRVNSDKIVNYYNNKNKVLICLIDNAYLELEFSSEDDAKLYLAGLDRLLGVKEPMYIKK